MESYKVALKKGVKEIEDNLITAYMSTGRNASGKWLDDLSTEIKESKGNINIKFKGSFYTEMLEKGRKPNKNQDHKKLVGFALFMSQGSSSIMSTWCRNKGIAEQYAFSIAYAVGREGYEGKPFIEKALNKDSANKLIKDIGLSYAQDVRIEILNSFRSGNN